ncbi:uncharacterized protein Z518_05337 [Rhinocladiella mackenziei CBS 650.93]|uniref:NADH dehydrogenase [ubiquinone] 1 alpha subcomplex assembly factor 3 n=1 Tax=Rhinocladiella mackenziei CBS 650.93 TaxID=1442369 RepID=A0A0D2IF82_9EURO|nr:uncharacterized protein Z518_05337 [Rhinocladiella mackenziei CBS 650.93]KIX04469.1 hypothetical protein Z518_05337 [Rhinocladiella mackenziei CBS 650.93]
MRAPSTDLLRVLRLTVDRPTERPVPLCTAARRLAASRTLTFSSRSLTTSSKPNVSSPSASPTRSRPSNPRAPTTYDRGPASQEETQTDFSKMDILSNAGAVTPATAIDACYPDGFQLNNGIHTSRGVGVLLLDGETFLWTPWTSSSSTTKTKAGDANTNIGGTEGLPGFKSLLDARSSLTIPPSSLGILAMVYPKPDLLIVGTGRALCMLSRDTRRYLSEDLGVKVDVMDTANAAAAYNLLATERGTAEVGALMIPEGFKG